MEKKKEKIKVEYAKSHYHRVPLDLKIEQYQRIKSYCEQMNVPINTMIKEAIEEYIGRRTAGE